MKEFLNTFDFNQLTAKTWINISNRLQKTISETTIRNERYKNQIIQFKPDKNNSFLGIINYFHSYSNNQIENEIDITVSSRGSSSSVYEPSIVISKENKPRYFYTNDKKNSWICFDFKNRKIIPTDYTIRSGDQSKNGAHMRNWIFECSIEKSNCDTLDVEKDCPHLNDKNAIHTFHIGQQNANPNGYRYLRIKETDVNWQNDNFLSFNKIEIFGYLL